ncbi:MAG TPA: carboxymuconolactone decarboxylase family protein [Mycobacteriales bacterium]|nr:carboxymuconolactone decarboxylase family protein [Mycobacteriales bacterium]
MADAGSETDPRLHPLRPREWPESMRAALAVLRPEGARHSRPRQDADRPKGLNALGTLALHPDLTYAYHCFVGHILFNTTLSIRQRELLILRVAAIRGSDYEWAQHIVLAIDNGISREEIAAVADRTVPLAWSPLEGALLDAADELVAEAAISDPTWQTLAAELDQQQLMDLIFTVGAYDALAMLFRSGRVQIDDDLLAWLAANDAEIGL